MDNPVTLAPDYYLDNFVKLISHAQHWYSDLLECSEHEWITHFNQLDRPSQCLLVRLYSRRGCWFRSDKINYAEIPDIPSRLDTLVKYDFIAINPILDTHGLASSLLTKPELCALFPQVNKSLRKEQFIASIPNTPFSDFNKIGFEVIHLKSDYMIDLLLTLFFANTHQDLSQFVLDELGLNQFEKYELSKERRFFSSRIEIEQLLSLSSLAEEYSLADRQCLSTLTSLSERIPDPVPHAYIERKRQHMINDIARDFERLSAYDKALGLFRQTQLPPSRERQARILAKLDEDKLFSDVVTGMLTQPENAAELEVATKLEQRVKRKRGLKVPRASKPKCHECRLELDLSQQRVELAVKAHFEKNGWNVFYVENHFLNGLLGLAFWELFFAPVEGAFINAYQYKPLDLYHADFLSKRQKTYDKAVETISAQGLLHLKQRYEEKLNISNPFIHWPSFAPELIDHAETAIPTDTLLSLFEVQFSDLKLYRNGMPDLIAFKDNEYRWIEVKGPGDKLQDNQWRWIKEFDRLGVPFSVCYVNQ
ncbi:VRR-NUC domain-containing protein [Vibrio japonicus]|uniref:phosphodiesterase I n=1 Tax=Vibrio japonicus TaxID=1824638 RepID=A0ABY5LP60_9VIBR|nr:VRR-NUC domain-containing protein [Vibrio japonicus]UUM33191.1 VRR-NUC domain-containing protein [Vibrio japonicus]